MRKVKYRIGYDNDHKEVILEGFFHEWSFDKNGPVAIVETPGGQIELIRSGDIQFIKEEPIPFKLVNRPTSNTCTESNKKQGI